MSQTIGSNITYILFYLISQVIVLSVGDAENTTECDIFLPYSMNNNSGICKPLMECPAAIGLLQAGIKPTLCSPASGMVCCPTKKRISAIKCEEFINILKEPIRANEALMYDGGSVQRRNDDGSVKCEAFLVTFIVGGRKAREREYPYQVALGYGDTPDWRCGGTLIDSQWIVTAGHCANTIYGPPTMVLLGDRALNRKDVTRKIVNVSEVYLHPGFKPPIEYNDIALLKLAAPIELSRSILPACLPDPADRLDRAVGVEATGWGQTSSFGGGQSNFLQSTTLAKFDIQECSQFFGSDDHIRKRLPKGILRSQFCAGDKHGFRDTCKGDSGGPVTVTKENETCVRYIVGITSFGSNLCGYQQPAVYTNILSYLDWIEAIVWFNLTYSNNLKLYAKIASGNELILNSNPTTKTDLATLPMEKESDTTTTEAVTKPALQPSESTSSKPNDSLQLSEMQPPTPITSTIQQILNGETTNIPSLPQINGGYFSRISTSISSLLSNISIGR